MENPRSRGQSVVEAMIVMLVFTAVLLALFEFTSVDVFHFTQLSRTLR